MIYITTAMYYEAQPIIKSLDLKKDLNYDKFQVFKNDDVVLIISGVGFVKASIAATYILTSLKKSKTLSNNDIFINFGICASIKEKSGVVMCNKIIDHCTKRSYYPDVIFKHPFLEGTIETFPCVVNENKDIQGDFVDMEASGAFQAASLFFHTHQMYFIKVISDLLNSNNITGDSIKNLVGKNLPKIISWFNVRKSAFSEEKELLSDIERKYILEVEQNLNITQSMKHEFLTLCSDYKVRRKNSLIDILKLFSKRKCNSKREGKIYFEELRSKLMEL